jgi:hypothetical protein
MSRDILLRLIEGCEEACRAGVSLAEIRGEVLPEKIRLLLKDIPPQEFLEWVKEDREYGYYYYDAQQSGACAKPAEAMALILEAIVMDALE